MSENRHFNVLVTRELTSRQLAFAEDLDLYVSVEPAIRIEFRDDWLSVRSALTETADPVFVFTSRNGVKGFSRLMEAGMEVSDGARFYAVGNKTSEAVKEMLGGDAIVPEGRQDGMALAKKIIENAGKNPADGQSPILHFCGNRRREEFRHFLSESGLKVKDVVVYRTILNEMELDVGSYDAILFYSPSAVQAFRNSGGFRQKKLPELFAVGNTTGQELSIESGRHVHISPKPSTEVLLRFTARILNENQNTKIPC